MCMLLHEGACEAVCGVLVWGVYKMLMRHAGVADDGAASMYSGIRIISVID